jgi:hypothetical protein
LRPWLGGGSGNPGAAPQPVLPAIELGIADNSGLDPGEKHQGSATLWRRLRLWIANEGKAGRDIRHNSR